MKTGVLIAIWSAAFSGWQIQSFAFLMLTVHLLSGLAGVLVLAVFLREHWWQRRHLLARHANARWGLASLAILLSLVFSGTALLRWTNMPWLQRLHAGASVALMAVLTFHIAWRLRTWLGRVWQARWSERNQHRPRLGSHALHTWLAGGVLTMVLIGAAGGLSGFNTTTRQRGQPAAEDVLPIAHASLPGGGLPGAGDCATCHNDLTSQWRNSIHAHAASDPYYQALAAMFVQERGVEALRYCTACHAPLGLMQGEVVRGAEAQAAAAESSDQAYTARALGVNLPVSPLAAEGVTCAVCHLAVRADASQNAGLNIDAAGAVLPGRGLPRLALRSAPDAHRQQVRPDVLEEAALCGACHNLRSPSGLLLEPTYQEWLDSPYPEQGKSCQSCHFPPAKARLVDGSTLGMPAAHGGHPGAPSSLPGASTSTALLRQAAELSIATLPGDLPGELALSVTVTNSGAGHYLPTGADDLRQVWLEVTLLDENGAVLWQSGGLDDYGELSPGAVQFRKVLGDASGRVVELHRFWVATQVLEDTRLGPLESRQIAYAIPVPANPAGPLRLMVRMLYRDVPPAFAAFALARPVTDLAVFEISQQFLEIGPSQLITVR